MKLAAVSVSFKIFLDAWTSFRNNPRIFVPFVVFACLELLGVLFLYLIPRAPLRPVAGPFLTTFYGEQYLHYPYNFVLLPKLASFARMGLSLICGSLLTGVAIAWLYRLKASVALRKYAHLFLVILIMTVLYYLLNRLIGTGLVRYFRGHEELLFLSAQWWLGPLRMVLTQIMVLFLQGLFVYAIPTIISSEKKFFSAIVESCVLFFKRPLVTLLIVGVPMLLHVPLAVLHYHSAYLMNAFVPEIVLLLLAAGVAINSLIIDPLITLSASLFYQRERRP